MQNRRARIASLQCAGKIELATSTGTLFRSHFHTEKLPRAGNRHAGGGSKSGGGDGGTGGRPRSTVESGALLNFVFHARHAVPRKIDDGRSHRNGPHAKG